VVVVSACATGFVNAFAHRERLGWMGASLLAILITGFVEKFYFALRHGLTTIYKSRKQRFVASNVYEIPVAWSRILHAILPHVEHVLSRIWKLKRPKNDDDDLEYIIGTTIAIVAIIAGFLRHVLF
jgi:hypothetical protein